MGPFQRLWCHSPLPPLPPRAQLGLAIFVCRGRAAEPPGRQERQRLLHSPHLPFLQQQLLLVFVYLALPCRQPSVLHSSPPSRLLSGLFPRLLQQQNWAHLQHFHPSPNPRRGGNTRCHLRAEARGRRGGVRALGLAPQRLRPHLDGHRVALRGARAWIQEPAGRPSARGCTVRVTCGAWSRFVKVIRVKRPRHWPIGRFGGRFP